MRQDRFVTATATGRATQGGFVLVMALVFLILLTLIGVSSLSTTSLEEKMAFNVRDKNLALESAEATVEVVRQRIGMLNFPVASIDPSSPISNDGLHNSVTSEPAWKTVNWQASSDLIVFPELPVLGALPDPDPLKFVTAQPRYIIERITNEQNCNQLDVSMTEYGAPGKCLMFRITARAVGGTAAAVALVQGTVKKIKE